MRPPLAGARQFRALAHYIGLFDRPPEPRACTNCVLSVLGGQHRNPAPTDVSTEQRSSTKRGIGGNPVSAPVCSHECPYVGFFRCPTTAFRTFTSSRSSWSGRSS